MGRRKAIYQHSVPTPRQDPSVRGRASQGAPRDGRGGLALDGSSRSAASRPFWGRRRTAAPPKESAGPSATGNRKSGTLPRCGRLEHTGKKSDVSRRELAPSVKPEPVHLENRQFHRKGPQGGHCPPGSSSSRPPLPRQHSGLSAASWEAPTCGGGSADTAV